MSRIVFGYHPVGEALRRRASDVQELVIGRSTRLGELLARAERQGVRITRASGAELDRLCGGGAHQGVAAVVGPYPYVELEELLERDHPPLLVAADSLQDPQNLGSIIRSAAVLGATGIILPKDRSVHVTPAVVRVSAGATESFPCAMVTNLARSLAQLRDAGLWIAGTVEAGGMHPADADLTVPLVLVLGSEQRGLRPLVQRSCDLLLTIPSRSAIASLNVAAAAATLFYEVARQRRPGARR